MKQKWISFKSIFWLRFYWWKFFAFIMYIISLVSAGKLVWKWHSNHIPSDLAFMAKWFKAPPPYTVIIITAFLSTCSIIGFFGIFPMCKGHLLRINFCLHVRVKICTSAKCTSEKNEDRNANTTHITASIHLLSITNVIIPTHFQTL